MRLHKDSSKFGKKIKLSIKQKQPPRSGLKKSFSESLGKHLGKQLWWNSLLLKNLVFSLFITCKVVSVFWCNTEAHIRCHFLKVVWLPVEKSILCNTADHLSVTLPKVDPLHILQMILPEFCYTLTAFDSFEKLRRCWRLLQTLASNDPYTRIPFVFSNMKPTVFSFTPQVLASSLTSSVIILFGGKVSSANITSLKKFFKDLN